MAKNIDRTCVGLDLNGKPATDSELRVDAWASTWGIRKSSKSAAHLLACGASCGDPCWGPEHPKETHLAANKATQIEGKEGDSVAWDRYCRARGGAFCGRKAHIQLAMREPDSPGTYGDGASLRPYGVITFAVECSSDSTHPSAMSLRFVPWKIESSHRKWEIVSSNKCKSPPLGGASEQAKLVQPTTNVNNCTHCTESATMRHKESRQEEAKAECQRLSQPLHTSQGDPSGPTAHRQELTKGGTERKICDELQINLTE